MQFSDQPVVVHRILKHDSQSNIVNEKQEDEKPLKWSWQAEHEDRKREAKADAAVHGAAPFQVDRKLLKDIVREKMDAEVVRIKFLGAGESLLLVARLLWRVFLDELC